LAESRGGARGHLARALRIEDYDDLARALGCTASAARVRMHRAMQQLNTTFTRMNGVPIDV
jgi:DNA-directed RNA polymerase specialized sigma24 family protein